VAAGNGTGSANGLAPNSGTSRYPIVQPSPTSRGSNWTQLSADRIRKYTWPRTDQAAVTPTSTSTSTGGASGHCTPSMPPPGAVATAPNIAPLCAANGASASPRSSVSINGGSEILVAAQQRFGRYSAPPPAVANTVTQASRSWRSSRDAQDHLAATDVALSARGVRRESQSLQNSIAELTDLKREMAVYMDVAREEKHAKHEAVAAQHVAESRLEEALRAQQIAEQRLGEQLEQTEKLKARNALLEVRMKAVERAQAAGSPGTATPPPGGSESARLQAANASLEREVATLREQLKSQALEVVEKIGDTLQRSNTELEVYRNQMKEEVAMRGRMDAEMAVIRSEKRKVAEELQRYKREYAELQRNNSGLEQEFAELRDQYAKREREAQQELERFRLENKNLKECTQQMQRQVEELSAAHLRAAADEAPADGSSPRYPGGAFGEATPVAAAAGVTSGSSESRLRSALAGRGGTTAELAEAIAAVEAMVSEAKRELQNRKHRERRAAYEALHKAETCDDEAVLEQALAEAQRTEVDREEIEKAEAVLAKLRSMTREEREAKDAAKRRAKSKEQAFLLVKRDAAEALRALLAAVEEEEDALPEAARGQRWAAWKDHAGRTLLRASKDLRAKAAHEVLKELIDAQAAAQAAAQAGESSPSRRGMSGATPASASPERSPILHTQAAQAEACTSGDVRLSGLPPSFGEVPAKSIDASAAAPLLPGFGDDRASKRASAGPAPETTPEAPTPTPSVEAQEPIKGEDELRTKAFRSVVKDDTASLAEVIIDRVPVSIWSAWKNKAGKDLLTLSEERGSSAAYSLLAKALGLLKERKRESYEEREAVWVLFTGEVQPRRATVLEDTPAEADEILLEFWDGDEPASHIDRSYVLKACC